LVRASAVLGVISLSAGLLAVPGAAQAQERGVAPWAPQWKVGAWWEVKTFQKDLSRETTSPDPAEGAMPRMPEEEVIQLPDYPPLRDGIPLGYKPGNTFRFDVVRVDAVQHDDDPPGAPPERFWVIAVKTLEGSEPRTAELWYAVADLSLSKIVLSPGTPKARESWTRGTASVDLPQGASLGFPLDWPDLRAAKKDKAEVRCGKVRYEQRVRMANRGTPKAEVQMKLTRLSSKRDAEIAPSARFVWKKERPFWTRLMTPNTIAQLERHSR
jgi:hypothetical protein